MVSLIVFHPNVALLSRLGLLFWVTTTPTDMECDDIKVAISKGCEFAQKELTVLAWMETNHVEESINQYLYHLSH